MHSVLPDARRAHPAGPGDSGFALLEVLVAAVLFAIVSASATVAIAKSISVSNTTRNRVTATGLAAAAVSRARADTASLIAAPNVTTTTSGYTVARTATIPVVNGIRCPAGQTIPLTVTVAWQQTGNRLVRIDTVIAC
jgi:prepilin-type N-terminal cleavage/methylation domain-containing protein